MFSNLAPLAGRGRPGEAGAGEGDYPLAPRLRIVPLIRLERASHSSHLLPANGEKALSYFSFVKITVPDAANMPPTPWHTEIFAPGTCAGAMPRIWRTLSCSAYMPYMPECI